MGDDNASNSEHFTVVSSSGQATGQLTEILSSSHVAVLSNIASSPNILGPNTSASLNTYVTSGNIVPACSTVTLSTLNNLTSSTNAISYHPSLSFHPTLGNPTVAYQTLVPHPNFGHPNITSYTNLSCQSPVTTHPRPNSLPPLPALTVLPTQAMVMPFNSPTIVNTGPDLTMAVAQAPMLQVLNPQEQLSCHPAVNVQSPVSHSPQQNAPIKHSEMELISSASTSWTSENVATASKQPSPKGKTRPNQGKNSSSNPLEDVSSECFICSSAVTVAAVSLSAVMPHSHAPLLVLLADVLGYVLASHSLHSKVVCSSCYRLLEVIDEVQNTQTKNKADVRRRFQLTVASKHLSYARSQQANSRWLCRRCGVLSLSQGGPRKRAALATHRGRKRSLRWHGSVKGRPSRTKDPVRQSKEEAHDDKDAKEVRRPAETVTVEPDIHVEDLTKLKCGTNASAASVKQQSPLSINKPDSVHTNGTSPTSNGHTSTTPPPTAAPPSGGSALLPIFDNDPALFAAGERLKVGVMRRAFLSRQCRYQCHYCSHACESAVTLKMHVRVLHMPLLVYDADDHLANGNASGSNDAEEDQEGGKFCLRMGVRLQNVSTDPLSVKPFVCLFCEWAYKLESSLQSHYRDQHSPRKPFQCPRCPDNFRRNLELTRHRLYRCPERAKGTKRLKKH